MSEPIKKRKAKEQLTPYSPDIQEEDVLEEALEERSERPVRKAKVKKNVPLEKSSLKGIFGNVSLTSRPKSPKRSEREEMMAGLNSSFLKSVRLVLEKQSNRDLRYLFEQYNSFIRDIENNNG